MASDPQSESDPDLRRQIEELREQVSVNSGRIEDLEHHAEVEDELVAVLRAEGLLKDHEVTHLREALGASRRIGAALGIIMAAHKVDETAAFALLRAHSQNTNRRLRELADDVVATGDVTGLAPPS